MKKLLLLAVLFLLQYNSTYSQSFNWAKSLAGRGTPTPISLSPGTSLCYGIAVDNDKNVYITGYSNDTVDFDPGPAEDLLVGGNDDIYIAKYDPNGNLIWAHVFKSGGWNYSVDIKLDSKNNIIITGNCSSDADFDPGPGVSMLQLNSGNANYIFIAKYDSDGNFIWAENMQSPFGTFSNSIAIGDSDNIYITGLFYIGIDLDPGPDTGFAYSNLSGLFFAKYDSAGNFYWAKSIQDVGSFADATKIIYSSNDNIYISGYFTNTVDFDPGPGVSNLTAATTAERFFARYDAEGNFSWAKNINTNDNGALVAGRSITLTVDDLENVYIAGDFSGTVDFDPAPPQQLLSNPGTYGTYFGKYDPNGNFLWIKGLFGGYCVATHIELDCYSNINLAGTFRSADFDPGPGVDYYIASAASAFMNFFAQYDSAGNYNWSRMIGNCGYGGGVIHPAFTIKDQSQYMAGGFKQTGDFDPSPDSSKLTSSGVGSNTYFAKYSSENKFSLGNVTSVCKKDTLTLDVSYLNGIYQWQDNSALDHYHVIAPGTYWVTVTSRNCIMQDTIKVDFHSCDTSKIKMPNVFTPNGDYKNDTFKPIEAKNIEQYQLKIFNRWGEKLFETTDQSEGWNGQFNNMECSSGTYYFILEYKYFDDVNSSMKGFLTLIR